MKVVISHFNFQIRLFINYIIDKFVSYFSFIRSIFDLYIDVRRYSNAQMKIYIDVCAIEILLIIVIIIIIIIIIIILSLIFKPVDQGFNSRTSLNLLSVPIFTND